MTFHIRDIFVSEKSLPFYGVYTVTMETRRCNSMQLSGVENMATRSVPAATSENQTEVTQQTAEVTTATKGQIVKATKKMAKATNKMAKATKENTVKVTKKEQMAFAWTDD